MTSEPTKAMLAAAAGVPHRIPFGGRIQLQYAPDVAAAFVAAARAHCEGATVHNLAGSVVHMDEVVSTIAAAAGTSDGTISYDDVRLPFPEEVDATSLTAACRNARRHAVRRRGGRHRVAGSARCLRPVS